MGTDGAKSVKENTIPEFGVRVGGIRHLDRPAAYALIRGLGTNWHSSRAKLGARLRG